MLVNKHIVTVLVVLFCSICNPVFAAGSSAYDAAKSGNLEDLREYRFNGIDLHIPDEMGFIPYELAALYADSSSETELRKRVEIMLWLKEYKAKHHKYGKASIKLVQSGLNSLGYDVGSVDGNQGGSTNEAIRSFQRENDLSQTGVMGPHWLGALYKDILRDLQFKLTKIGYSTKGVDGEMGYSTKNAIKKFKTKYELKGKDYNGIDYRLVVKVNDIYSNKKSKNKPNLESRDIKKKESDIKYLQAGLIMLGHKIGKIDGQNGGRTVSALKSFQKKYNLISNGKFNDKTKKIIDNVFLKEVQKKLQSLGYKVGKVDGTTSDSTKKAIADYRKKYVKLGGGESFDTSLILSVSSEFDRMVSKKEETKGLEQSNDLLGKYLQAGLRTLGYKINKVDGYVGDDTIISLKKFQEKYRLSKTGKVDTKTKAKMDFIFLKETQRKLNYLGYEVGNTDGEMGSTTKKQINKYIKNNGLVASDKLNHILIKSIGDSYDSLVERQKKSKKESNDIVKKEKKIIISKDKKYSKKSTKLNSKKLNGRMTFKRRSGRVVGCSIASRNIPIEWCEPFYPLRKNNSCKALFKSNGRVVNLWCK